MGLSFHDDNSIVEASIGSLRFAHDDQSLIAEDESIGIVSLQERPRREDGDTGIQSSDNSDIQVVKR